MKNKIHKTMKKLAFAVMAISMLVAFTAPTVRAGDFKVGEKFKEHGTWYKVKIRDGWFILRKSGSGKDNTWGDAGNCKSWVTAPAVMAGHLASLAADKDHCSQ